jgi:3-methyladenine DNA glycosylase AlkD
MTARAREVIEQLRGLSTAKDRANLARFGIDAPTALGVSMANIQKLAKRLGRDHALAGELWATGVYEARLLCAFVEEPDRVTAAQMERWCKHFDNWAVCDTLCFKLFDQTKHAWTKAEAWCKRTAEFEKRASLAVLSCPARVASKANPARFLASLAWIEAGADDERNFVKKGVSWALRRVGMRGPEVKKASLALAARLAASEHVGARWVGRDALRDLAKRR